MTGFEKTLIIIPAHNESAKLSTVIAGIRHLLPSVDILVIDDGSTDGTRGVAYQTGTEVVSHPFNLGYGSALQTGYQYALIKGYETILQMDGDGQHDPSFIPDLLGVIQKGEADIAIGSRFLNKGGIGSGVQLYRAPLIRQLGMKLFSTVTSSIIRQKITDSTSGFQAMNRKALEWVSSDRFPCDYPDADVIIMLHRAGFRIQEVPVRMFESQNKQSMHGGWKPLYYVFKMFLSILVTLMRR